MSYAELADELGFCRVSVAGPGSASCTMMPSPEIAAQAVLTKRRGRSVDFGNGAGAADRKAACSVAAIS
jgi:hypothetical protein